MISESETVLFQKKLWPGYFLIILGLIWAFLKIAGVTIQSHWMLFFLFLAAGLLGIVLSKRISSNRLWFKEIGIFLLTGSLGYLGVCLGLLQEVGIASVWGIAGSILLVRLFFRNPHFVLVYFLAVLLFLYSCGYFLSQQVGLSRNLIGSLFLNGLGLGFLYLYLLAPQKKENSWALIPGILLTPLGLFLISHWNQSLAVQIVSALELIVLGVWMVWQNRRNGESLQK